MAGEWDPHQERMAHSSTIEFDHYGNYNAGNQGNFSGGIQIRTNMWRMLWGSENRFKQSKLGCRGDVENIQRNGWRMGSPSRVDGGAPPPLNSTDMLIKMRETMEVFWGIQMQSNI